MKRLSHGACSSSTGDSEAGDDSLQRVPPRLGGRAVKKETVVGVLREVSSNAPRASRWSSLRG